MSQSVFTSVKKGELRRNMRTGEIGIVTGVWMNEHTGQSVVNVRVNGRAASWNRAVVGVVR